jgi:hypothetical protein
MGEARSWARERAVEPETPHVAPAIAGAEGTAAPVAVVVETPASAAALPPPAHTPTTAADLVAPLSLILSSVMKFPSTGNAILDTLLFHLRDSAKGVADEAVDSVVRTVRYGDRSKLLAVLGTAVLVPLYRFPRLPYTRPFHAYNGTRHPRRYRFASGQAQGGR